MLKAKELERQEQLKQLLVSFHTLLKTFETLGWEMEIEKFTTEQAKALYRLIYG